MANDSHSLSASPDRQPWRVLVICILVVVSTALSPPLIRLLGLEFWLEAPLTQRQDSALSALSGFVLVLMILGSGVLGDLYGRRRVLLGLMALHVLSLVLAVLVSGTDYWLWSLRLVAVIKAMIAPLLLAILINQYSGANRLRALVIYSGLSALVYLLVPVADRWLLAQGATLLLVAPPVIATLIGIFLVRRYVPGERNSRIRPRPASVIAVAVWAAAVCSLVYGALLLLGLGLNALLPYMFLALGIITLVLINRFEQRPISETWRYTIYRERPLAIAILTGIVLVLALKTVFSNLYYFFTDIRDFSVLGATLMLLPVLLGGILLGGLAVKVADSRSEHAAIAIGMAILGGATAGLAILAPDVPYLLLAPSLLALGLGYVLANAPRVLLLARSVPDRLDACVQAIGVATATVGGALAYSVTLGLIDFFSQRIYAESLAALGAGDAFIEGQLALVQGVLGASEKLLLPEQQASLIATLVPAYEAAYVMALARVMLVLALICFAVALLAYFGLRESDLDTSPPPVEIEFIKDEA